MEGMRPVVLVSSLEPSLRQYSLLLGSPGHMLRNCTDPLCTAYSHPQRVRSHCWEYVVRTHWGRQGPSG